MNITPSDQPAAPNLKIDFLTWWLPLLLICILAAFLRLFAIGNDLPVNTDPDEPTYYLWALGVRETGRVVPFYDVDQNRGVGYPPAILYTMIGIQTIFEAVSNDAPSTPAFMTRYFYAGRFFVALLGIATVVVGASLGRMVSKSHLAGLLVALSIAIWNVAVLESRRFTANVPWLFFTTLVFLLLFHARNTKQLGWLYLALLAGILSGLFQYQANFIVIFPFIFAVIYFRDSQPRLFWHLVVWAVALLIMLAWLIFSYGTLEIFNLNFLSFFSDSGDPTGLQSFNNNWPLVTELVGSPWYLRGALITLGFAVYAAITRQFTDFIDVTAIFSFAAFSILFYVAMSFFAPLYIEKWLVLLPIIHIMAFTAIFTAARLLGQLLEKFTGLNGQWATAGLQLVAFTAIIATFANTYIPHWQGMYHNRWQATHTIVQLHRWFEQNVPQGGRLVEEANKLVYNYPYAPQTTHSYARGSIFDEPVEAYRARGYEYLIWNSFKSNPTDGLADLESDQNRAYLQDLEEVLRITGEGFYGPDIVVYKLDPLPVYETYAWFGDIISFRGYDLPSTTLAPGDELALTLYWMSIFPTEADLMVFVHIWDATNQQMIAQQDGPPGQGLDPTWQWLGDMQFHSDPHTITIPGDAPPGEYEVRIGMYDIATGTRLPVTPVGDEPLPGDYLTLQTMEIEP